MEQPQFKDIILTELNMVESIALCDNTIQHGIDLANAAANLLSIKQTIETNGLSAGLIGLVGTGLDTEGYSLKDLTKEEAVAALEVSIESFLDMIRRTIAAILASIKQFIFEFLHNIKRVTATMTSRHKTIVKFVKDKGEDAIQFKNDNDKSFNLNYVPHKNIIKDYNIFNTLFSNILHALNSGQWKDTKKYFGKFSQEHVDSLEEVLDKDPIVHTVDSAFHALDKIEEGITATEEFLKISEPITKQLKKTKINKSIVIGDNELDPVILLQRCTRLNNMFIKTVFDNLKSYLTLLDNIEIKK